ncbi:MAG: hypothetical protein Q4D54_09270 [Eubacteriales bacterium]|nr:hypothetical protein [Eubacteriales bacterium]
MQQQVLFYYEKYRFPKQKYCRHKGGWWGWNVEPISKSIVKHNSKQVKIDNCDCEKCQNENVVKVISVFTFNLVYTIFGVIQGILQQQKSIIANASSGLNEIGLGELVSNFEYIDADLDKQVRTINDLSESLDKIVKRYIMAEEVIMGNGVAIQLDNVSRTSNTGDQSIDDFWNNDEYFDEYWYKDHDKFIEAYKKMIEELKNGRISFEELLQNKHMVELLQYIFGADVDGYPSEFTFNMLQDFTDDFEGNGNSFSLNDFLSYGSDHKYDWILSALQTGLSAQDAQAAYDHNSVLEEAWNNAHSHYNQTYPPTVHPVYIDNQEDAMIAGMYSNPNEPVQSNASNTFCENIAIYNAMEYYNPGSHESLSQIVYDNTMNHNLMQAGLFGYEEGGLGTNPYTIPETLEGYGYQDSTNIVTHVTGGVHTYCLTAGEDANGNACYYSHNEYGDPPIGGPYYSVGEYITQLGDYKKPKEVFEVIGVNEP